MIPSDAIIKGYNELHPSSSTPTPSSNATALSLAHTSVNTAVKNVLDDMNNYKNYGFSSKNAMKNAVSSGKTITAPSNATTQIKNKIKAYNANVTKTANSLIQDYIKQKGYAKGTLSADRGWA